MRSFWGGLLVGILVTYWYFTQGDYVRALAASLWTRASAAPPYAQHKP